MASEREAVVALHNHARPLLQLQHVQRIHQRANLLVDGLDLPGTVGNRLRIGDCLFEIHGETDPCERMDELQAGLRAGLVPEMRGGVWGRVLESGQLRVGQAVEVAE